MYPVLTRVTLFGMERPIASYGVMLALGLLVASLSFVWLAARAQMDVGRVIAANAIAVTTGFVGANVLFACVEWARTGELVWRDGRFGLVFFGAALGGACGLWLASRLLSLPFARLVDHAAIGLALGHAIGRIGCFLGGCCYGFAWHGIDGHGSFAVTYTDALAPAAHPSVPRFPTPLLEAGLVLLLIALVFRHHVRSGERPGSLALRYALGYATLRLLLEQTRGDGVRGVIFDGMLSTAQLIALLVIVATAPLLLRFRAQSRLLLVVGLACVSAVSLSGASVQAQLAMQAPALIQIGAGWFTMGSDDADVEAALALCRQDADRPDLCRPEIFDQERPQRRVYLSAYRIDRTEVSNASYRRCVSANICAPQRVSDADPRLSAPEHPVTGVTFAEASRYCGWLGGVLPTEAQWEKAARGQNARTFPWGNLWNSRIANHGRGISAEDPIDGYNYAAPVDAFVDARSPYGLLNMAGNVAELTRDYYDERGYAEAARIDPTGPTQGSDRVVRGGSWRTQAFTLRTTFRMHIADNDTQPDVGFRCSYAP